MGRLFDGAGRPIGLRQKLGSGGEGDVFEVVGTPEIVAKLYHHAPTPEKQLKLRSMAHSCDDALKMYAAWPLETLHDRPGGLIVGFLMPKVSGYEPIHKLYSPAHRKHLYPRADWAFLVHVARNMAASFAAIHACGHVIGDVNQGNVVVAANGLVRLIDCDSFQIMSNGQNFVCEVGVQHFTPPECNRSRPVFGFCSSLAVGCFG
jgi:DNA-binding helix-hairpin-helix protein with protein kinase domain